MGSLHTAKMPNGCASEVPIVKGPFVLTDKETLKVTTTGLLGGSWLLSYSGNSQNSGGSSSNWTDLWNLDGGGGFAAWIKASLQITVSEYFIDKQKSKNLKIWMFIPCFMKVD